MHINNVSKRCWNEATFNKENVVCEKKILDKERFCKGYFKENVFHGKVFFFQK